MYHNSSNLLYYRVFVQYILRQLFNLLYKIDLIINVLYDIYQVFLIFNYIKFSKINVSDHKSHTHEQECNENTYVLIQTCSNLQIRLDLFHLQIKGANNPEFLCKQTHTFYPFEEKCIKEQGSLIVLVWCLLTQLACSFRVNSILCVRVKELMATTCLTWFQVKYHPHKRVTGRAQSMGTTTNHQCSTIYIFSSQQQLGL